LDAKQDTEPKLVWCRGRVHADRCPKSLITAESLVLLEEFWAWKRVGGGSYLALAARSFEAFVLLDGELVKEQNEQANRHQSTAGGDRYVQPFGR